MQMRKRSSMAVSNSNTTNPSSHFASSRLLLGFSARPSSDTDPSASPTSILETKLFSPTVNPFFTDTKPRSTWRSAKSRAVGLGIVDALHNEKPEIQKNCSNPDSRIVLVGSQLKIQIPSMQPTSVSTAGSFAVKFYTREGNWDLLGNNFPVFFIRDGIKFPDVIHAFKPNPKSHIQEYWRVFDFLSHHPESLHTFFFLFDDVGVPSDYRHMEGFGVNTYTFINKAGKSHYVKFHWKPTCGVKCLLEDEAVVVGGKNHSHATQDLYESIAAGNFPEWKLFVQVMDPAGVVDGISSSTFVRYTL